jgi:hypothetical protein
MSDGSYPASAGSIVVTDASCEGYISFLNGFFNGTGMQIFKLGKVNYGDSDNFGTSSIPAFLEQDNSYVRTALNFYSKNLASGFGSKKWRSVDK